MPLIDRLPAAILIAGAIAALAWRFRSLSGSGAVAATCVGAAVFAAGGPAGAAALLAFFVTSTGLSRWRKREKEKLLFEKGGRRDGGQVLANGGIAALCLLLSAFVSGRGATSLHVAFLAALAAANADTWATEIGAAVGGEPFSMRDLRRVPPGTSGAVTAAGTLAACAGAALVGACAWIPGSGCTRPGACALTAAIAGIAGALLDTLAGALLQAQWRDENGRWRETAVQPERSPDRGFAAIRNDAVNGICTGSAALLAFAMSWINAW